MNEKSFISSAPGKIHLAGEHASVYGKPALLTTINLRCKSTLSPRTDKTVELIDRQIDLHEMSDLQTIIDFTNTARRLWQKYEKTNDVNLLKTIAPNDIDLIKIAIGETLSYLGEDLTGGFSLNIDSEIPIGVGLGSSASMAASIANVIGVFLGQTLDKSTLSNIVYQCETRQHGFSSGGDIHAVIHGGLILYEKRSGLPSESMKNAHSVFFDLDTPILGKNLTLIQTGRPAESTGEIVSYVRGRYEQEPKEVQAIFDDIESFTSEMLDALVSDDFVSFCKSVNECHKSLRQLGVVTKFAQEIIDEIRNIGGAAKISGAGGISDKATGIILAFHSEPQKVVELAEQVGLPSFSVEAGRDGVL